MQARYQATLQPEQGRVSKPEETRLIKRFFRCPRPWRKRRAALRCWGMKTILAPIDFSTATDGVIEAAVSLARSLQAKIVLLHIVEPPTLASDYGLALESLHEAIALSEQSAARRLAEIRQRVVAIFPALDTELRRGTPTGEILEAAQRHQVAYIVVGSHGHTAIYDLLVGTTTHGILRKAPCPVVIVPPASKHRPAAPKLPDEA